MSDRGLAYYNTEEINDLSAGVSHRVHVQIKHTLRSCVSLTRTVKARVYIKHEILS